MPSVCPKCHYESPMETDYCPACGAPMNEHVLEGQKKRMIRAAAPRQELTDASLLTMKWYKFLIYASLPLSVILSLVNIVNGYQQVTTLDLALIKPEYVSLVPVVLYMDLAVAVLLMPVLIYAEIGLIRKQWKGVKALLFLYGFQAVYGALALGLLFYMGAVTLETVLSLVEAAALFFLNRVYFRKRRALFS